MDPILNESPVSQIQNLAPQHFNMFVFFATG